MKWWNKWRTSRRRGRTKILYLSHASVSIPTLTPTHTCWRGDHFLYLNTGSSSYFVHSTYLLRWCTQFGVFFLTRNNYKQRRMQYKKGKILFSLDLILLCICLYAIFCLAIFSRSIIWCCHQSNFLCSCYLCWHSGDDKRDNDSPTSSLAQNNHHLFSAHMSSTLAASSKKLISISLL